MGAHGAGSLQSRMLSRAALLLLFALLGACGKAPQGPPPRGPANVTVVAVTPREVPVSFEFVAQTQSPRAVNIQARVSGFLDRRVYTEGALVRAGQVLFLMGADGPG